MAATPQPFVVCVRGNTNDTSRTKALLTPPMSPAAVDALTKRVWSKLHGAAAAVPGEVDWAYENEAAISLLNPSDVTLLHTLSAQYLQARETYLTIRVKARHEAWQAIPKAVARDGRRNGKRRVIDSQPVGSMASGEELDIRTTSYMQAMEASDRSKPATRAQDKPSSPPSSSSSSSTSAEMSDCLWWLREDHPAARFLEIATMIVIVLSIINLVVQTIPQHRLNDDGTDKPEDRGSSFFIIESFCIAWFTIEFAMRLYATDDRRGFWLKPLNIVDIIAIVPYYISLGADGSAASSLAILRVLRLSRVLRMFKLSRHNEGLRTMIKCMALSGKELSLFLMVVTVAVILFASAMFYIEKDEDDTLFTSIPASMWWAVITLTTVGYGDIFPTTVLGRFVGAICACLGVVLLAISASIFVGEFMRLHQEIRRKKTESLPPVERAISMLETSLEAINNFTQDVGLSYKELIRLRKKKREGTEVMLLEDAGVPVRMSVAHAKYGIRGIDVY